MPGTRPTAGNKTPGLILHLGAHRTGSTRLQTLLDSNANMLAEAGIVALTPPRPGKRNATTIRDAVGALPKKRGGLFKRRRKKKKARALLSRLLAAASPDNVVRRVIVSEENMLGPAFETNGDSLYVSAYSKLVAFRQMLGRSPSEIHLTLRSYDTFLVSVYAMRAVYGVQILPFDEIRENLIAVRRGWPDLVADITRAFPGTPLTLTRAEVDPMASRIKDLVGSELISRMRFDGEKHPNVAPTVEAMKAAAGVSEHAAVDDLVARYANGTRFDPLSEEARTRLARRYTEDVKALGL